MKTLQLRFFDQKKAYEYIKPRLSITALVVVIIASILGFVAALFTGADFLTGFLLGLGNACLSAIGVGLALFTLNHFYLVDCLASLLQVASEKGYLASAPEEIFPLYDDRARELSWRRKHTVIVFAVMAAVVYFFSTRELLILFSAAMTFRLAATGGFIGFWFGSMFSLFTLFLAASLAILPIANHGPGAAAGFTTVMMTCFVVLWAASCYGDFVSQDTDDKGQLRLPRLKQVNNGFLFGSLLGIGLAKVAEQTTSAEEGYGTASRADDREAAGSVDRGQSIDSNDLAARLANED